MKIGLIDVDGHNFPNLALMKISAYHKSLGDNVEWVNHFNEYDKVYMSKIFTFTADEGHYIHSREIIKGGTGYNIKSKLPEDIENVTSIDYSLYPQYDYSIQFLSRGCIRNCGFCLVREKEGYISPCNPIELNPNGKHIEVLDNNFFANPEWRKSIDILKSYQQPVNLHGVDIRIMDDEQAKALSELRIKGNIHIAWDNPKQDIIPKIKHLLNHISKHKIVCYVLVGYNSTRADDLRRLYALKDIGVAPFVQAYRDFNNTRIPTQYEKDLMRYANKRQIFKTCKFEDFSPRKGFLCKEYVI